MRLFIGIIIGFLLSTVIVEARVFTKGGIRMETGDIINPGPSVTEDDAAPVNPVNGEIWRDITDGTIYTWNGSVWTVRNKSPDIQAEIDIFKANINSVNDPNARKCLKALGRIILKLYKDTVQ